MLVVVYGLVVKNVPGRGKTWETDALDHKGGKLGLVSPDYIENIALRLVAAHGR